MDWENARALFKEYGASVAYVETESASGERQVGSAFHVGDGVFVTARQVLAERRVVRVCTTERVRIPLEGSEAENARHFVLEDGVDVPIHEIRPAELEIDRGPFLAPDEDVDVAVFGVAGLDPHTPAFYLGSHLDDWLGRSDFVLTRVVVLGYPPIPHATDQMLAAFMTEVVAQVDRDDVPHVHFILSMMPREGLRGAVAFSEWGFVLGAVTENLVHNDEPSETGYVSVVSIEPIIECLDRHGLLPASMTEEMGGLWD